MMLSLHSFSLAMTMLPVWMLVMAVTTTAEKDDASFYFGRHPESWQNELVEWLQSKPNGYFSEKILWRRDGTGDTTYYMHADEDIAMEETLMVIPQGAIIGHPTEDNCVTIRLMLDEYEEGKKSAHYPYIKYLFHGVVGGISRGLLPGSWSPPAKELLKQIVGNDLSPKKFELPNVVRECPFIGNRCAAMGGEFLQRCQDAYNFWKSRSERDKMVPILDMIKHRNGKWYNVDFTSAHVGKDVHVYAKRDIKKGEQLHISYSECLGEDCDFGESKYTYVTPHILKDYGFVEALPRRWVFRVDKSGQRKNSDEFLHVEIDDDEDTGKLVFDWHYDTPNEKQLEWIEKQLKRLQSLDGEVAEGVSKLESSHEKDTILEYHRAYKEAFELALINQNAPVSTKTTKFDSDKDEEEQREDDANNYEDEEDEAGDEL